MDDLANAIGWPPKLIKAILALILIAVVYEINAKVGTALGVLAVLAILTQ